MSVSDLEGREQILRVEIRNGVLSITVGVGTLCEAIEASPYLENCGALPKITDQAVFAGEILRELEDEAEDGTTPVHMLFDKAALAAIENGCEGVHYDDYEVGR